MASNTHRENLRQLDHMQLELNFSLIDIFQIFLFIYKIFLLIQLFIIT